MKISSLKLIIILVIGNSLIVTLSIFPIEKEQHIPDESHFETPTELSYKPRVAFVTGINTEGFEYGDIVAFGDSCQLIMASPENIDPIIGVVIGEDSIEIFRNQWHSVSNNK